MDRTEARKRRVRRLRHDAGAGIEGLPLQLLIMVVVAGLGLTIIMGWMSSIAPPKAIGDVFVTPGEIIVYDDDGDGIYVREDLTLTVSVVDQGGDRIEGATVVLEGGNIRTETGGTVRGVTDSGGKVTFVGLVVEHFGRSISTITVTVAKGDYGVDSSFEIPVVPS